MNNSFLEKSKKILVILYLLSLSVAVVIIGTLIFCKSIEIKESLLQLSAYCLLAGIFSGIFRCLRSYYLHSSALKDWDDGWIPWYYVRPIVSGMAGLVSLLFIKTGLMLFGNTIIGTGEDKTLLYIAFAFICGYSVENFIEKIEKISQSKKGFIK